MMSGRTWVGSLGNVLGTLAAIVGAVASLFLIWVGVVPYLSVSLSGIEFVGTGSSLGAANAPTMLFWSIVILTASLLAGYAAWTERVVFVWALAVGFAVFAVLGGFSIGPVVVPTAVLLLCSAVVLTFGRLGGESESAATT